MTAVPPFLQSLDLGVDADERAIRRAYARQLRLIDQEADPAAFQALRETFERALQWAAWKAHEASQPPVPESPADVPAPPVRPERANPAEAPDEREAPAPATLQAAPDVAQEAADAVFADFLARLEHGIDSEAAATALVKAALEDERLVNLEARTFFEWRLACRIVGGWHPGHEFLFKPACEAFAWDTDRRRLALFHQVGAIVDAAIRERIIFFGQDPVAFELQRNLIRRMRQDKPADHGDLASEMPLLWTLVQRYPNWMRAMTRQEIVQHWFDAWNGLTPEQRQAQSHTLDQAASKARAASAPRATPAYKPKTQRSGPSVFWFLLVILGGLGRVVSGLSDPAPHASSYHASPETTPNSAEPWSRPLQQGFDTGTGIPAQADPALNWQVPTPSQASADRAAQAARLAEADRRRREAAAILQRSLGDARAQAPAPALARPAAGARYDYTLGGAADPPVLDGARRRDPAASQPPAEPQYVSPLRPPAKAVDYGLGTKADGAKAPGLGELSHGGMTGAPSP